jgi:hypothetical protein
MKNLALVLLLLAAFVLGFLAGSGELGRPGLIGSGSKSTEIRLRSGTAGRCVGDTKDKHLKARREWFVGWAIKPQGCTLPSGGLVQVRFTSGSPLLIEQPSGSDTYIAGYVNPSAENRTYPYKVWAHFPSSPSDDYILEDPDLEIVSYFTFF